MLEQRSSWPEEFDPSLEKIHDLGLFTIIEKPVRNSKPGRELTANAPRSEEINSDFHLTDVYTVRLEPLSTAGSHYHQEKIELIFSVSEPIEVYFHSVEDGTSVGIWLPWKAGNSTFGLVAKPGVAHTIRNPSPRINPYIVLSNRKEEDSLRDGDVQEIKFDLPKPQPITDFLE